MRIVVALGGNALLAARSAARRPRTSGATSRGRVRALAPLAREHELVITHGNGPQVGLLALQGAAYTGRRRRTRSTCSAPQTEGMIGYLLEQELGNRAAVERAARDRC